MKHLKCLLLAITISFSIIASSFFIAIYAAQALFSINVEDGNVLAVFQDSVNKEIKYEVVKNKQYIFFRTHLAPFIKLNESKIKGKRAAIDTIQAKLMELYTGRKNFSVNGKSPAVIVGDYVLIDLDRTIINGKAVNIKDLITSDSAELIF
jgi:hypothetical protein